MAYLIAANAVAEVTVESLLFGQEVQTTWHYQNDGPAIADGAAALAQLSLGFEGGTGPYDPYLACLASDVQVQRVKYQWIFPDRFRPIYTTPSVLVGQGAATETPNTACVLTLTGDIADRRGIANKHLPGLPANAMLNGLVSTIQKTFMDTLGNASKEFFTAGAQVYLPIIYGRERAAFEKCGRVYPALPVSKRPITGHLINPYVRVMRRRTVGLGS